MTSRDRMRLVAALLAAPLVIALPVLWPRLGEPGFIERNLDVLLIFIALPYAMALWIYLGGAGRPRG